MSSLICHLLLWHACYQHTVLADQCVIEANTTWSPPGGVSAGLTNCFQRFAEYEKQGLDPYLLIDPPSIPSVTRLRVSTGYDGSLPVVPWDVNISRASLYPDWHHFSYSFNRAEWIVPAEYTQTDGEVRAAFIHGGNAAESALGYEYAGLTMRLANWTGLPVFAFDYPHEPIVPWPSNLRQVLSFLGYALANGPQRSGSASKLLLIADSEGTLVAMQVVIAMRDATLRQLFGYNFAFPPSTEWVAGIVLSSPVLDITCQTPSFASGCYNFSDPLAHTPSGTGDPDTGNCSQTPDAFSKLDDCLWSYLE